MLAFLVGSFRRQRVTDVRLSNDQIDYLAFQVVKVLTDERVIATSTPDALHGRVVHLITEDLAVEDKLNEEVRLILSQYEGEMRREGAQYHEAFKMIKTKLARERRLIL